MDVCSHVPGGKHVGKALLTAYLWLFRSTFGLLGIRFEAPSWVGKEEVAEEKALT